uniref:Pogo transposable element derived with ZNF domain b n=1 Tax=Oncorhynchus mykiss TaxID=8022 RepID=A0A8K9Y468_ONCMY
SRETPIPSIPSLTPSAAQRVPATVSNTILSSSSVLQRTTRAFPGMPSLVPSGMVQGQQLIQIQTPTGLSTMLLPTAVNPGTGPANAQQIYFTQGFPVRNVRPGQNPMGIVLNLQQGQMIRPITLLSGPGGQFFAPSMGMPQVVTQPAQIRPTAGPSGVLRQAVPSTFATMQIPATLTIRGSSHAPLTTTASTMGTRPTLLNTSAQPQICKFLFYGWLLQIVKSNSQCKYVAEQNIGQMFPCSVCFTVDREVKICPRCGAQFKMQEALQGHMCFCCPDLVITAGPSSSSGTQNPLPELAPSSNPDPPPKVVMLVDDFYYGHFAGQQSLVDSQPTKLNYSFKCVICPKRSNSNIRLMDHMKQHPEMTKWVDQLTSCQHCFRQFSTSAQLQYHVENAHGPTQSSTCCKICEWAFESEPVFLHHMKNTHKPGEMPYICQVCRYRSSFFSDVYNHFCTNHAKTCNQLCVYCLKVFKSPNSYQQHYIRHQVEEQPRPITFYDGAQNHSHRTFRKPKQLEGLQPGTKVIKQRCMECSSDVPSFPDHYPTFVHCAVCPYSTCCSHVLSVMPQIPLIFLSCRNTTGADRFDDSSEWGPLGPESDLDEAMAPVEDMGSDTDNEEMEVEGLGKDVDEIVNEGESKQQPAVSDPPVTPPTVRPVVKEREDTLSVRLLRIVLFALCCGERQAAKQLSTQSNLIRTWLKNKEKQLERDGRGPGKGEAVERMVEWVMAQREQQLPLNEKNLFQRASEIHSQDGHSSAFRISYDWAVSFMLQHSLGWQAVGRTATVNCRLPRSMEDNANSFTKFTRKHIQAHDLPHTGIAAMDELSVFVDIEALADPAKVDKEEALQLVGTREPLVTIYLSALADGTMLRTLVLIKGQLPKMQGTGLPNSVLLEAKVEGFTRDEELALWESRVWRQHMLDQNRSTKGMLILDGHRGHVSKDFLTTLGATGTLPAVVPAGCTCRLQPLEMCLRPVLQSFLLARWARLAAEGGAAGATHKDLVQLLVAWLVEALSYLEEQPDLLRQSFHLTDLVPGQRDQEMTKTLAETQSELMSTLREALLGPEVLEPESPAELEQEDSRGTEDMEAGKERVDEKQETGEERVDEEQEAGEERVDEKQEAREERVDEKQEAGEERVDEEQEVKEGKVDEEQQIEEGTLDENHKEPIEMDTTKDNILEKGEEMEPLPESQEGPMRRSPPLSPSLSQTLS